MVSESLGDCSQWLWVGEFVCRGPLPGLLVECRVCGLE